MMTADKPRKKRTKKIKTTAAEIINSCTSSINMGLFATEDKEETLHKRNKTQGRSSPLKSRFDNLVSLPPGYVINSHKIVKHRNKIIIRGS